MSKKIYIAGKISGTDDYMTRFSRAERFLSAKGFEAINPARIASPLPQSSTSYREYIQLGFTLLAMCDAVYALQGWETSVGASLEVHYAKALGYEILFEEDFYDTKGSRAAEGFQVENA